jgi:hypothetical protein
VAVRVCASANGFQPAVRVFGQVPTVCQAGGVLAGGPRAFVGMHGEVVKIESPSNPLRLVREFVLPAVPASSVVAGAGAGIGAGEGDLKQLRRGGGALLSARFCCSHKGALIAVAAEELVFSRPEQGSAWELPLQTTSPCDPFSLGCVFQKGRVWARAGPHGAGLGGSASILPTEEEFSDPLHFIAQICEQSEPYGICRMVPPRS